MTQTTGVLVGHNGCPDDWRDDESCEDLMKSLLRLKDDPFVMEACHLGYIQFFGDSYRNSLFAGMVRRIIYEATGREGSMTTYIPDTDHAELTALLEKRRRLEIRRLRAKRLPSRSRLTLAEKLEIDRNFKAEMDELNRRIDEIVKRTGGSL